MNWILVLILLTSTDRLEQDTYPTRAECQRALTQAARTNYMDGFYKGEPKEPK